ncbi:mCG1030561, partial [Mus musculus]
VEEETPPIWSLSNKFSKGERHASGHQVVNSSKWYGCGSRRANQSTSIHLPLAENESRDLR